jgi:hypothetical protein
VSETPGMAQHEVTRTLVKSQPEVWTQCSDPDSLGRHLSGSFGEIRITRLDPEHSVAWEGEEVSGTVTIEPSAWGTRVTLAVEMADEVAELEQAAPPPEPELEAEVVAEAEAEAVAEAESEPEPAAMVEPEAQAPTLPAGSEPGLAPTRWERLRSWWRRAASVEPPPSEEPLPAVEPWPDEELPRDSELPPHEEMLAADDPASAGETSVAPEPELEPEPEPEPDAEAAPRPDTAAVLTAALESLGQAHHRPFSRA